MKVWQRADWTVGSRLWRGIAADAGLDMSVLFGMLTGLAAASLRDQFERTASGRTPAGSAAISEPSDA